MEDIEDLLIQIEEEVNNGKKSLFGNGVTIDPDIIFALVDRIRNTLPDIIREARYVVQNSEKRRAEEALKAQNIMLSAQKRAEEMLSGHTIIEQAEREAEAIRNQANEYRSRIYGEIKADINALLSDTEATLTESLAIVTSARNSNLKK
ncbi:MAG: hypothetical protein WC292_05145 [Clostridia bacterium]